MLNSFLPRKRAIAQMLAPTLNLHQGATGRASAFNIIISLGDDDGRFIDARPHAHRQQDSDGILIAKAAPSVAAMTIVGGGPGHCREIGT